MTRNAKRFLMVKNELPGTGNEWLDCTAATGPETGSAQSDTMLTGEEKKIFDAVFAGAIIGASLTALMFLLL